MWHEGGSFEEFEASLLDTLPDMKEAAEYSSEDNDIWEDE
jgi:hypothetical protein